MVIPICDLIEGRGIAKWGDAWEDQPRAPAGQTDGEVLPLTELGHSARGQVRQTHHQRFHRGAGEIVSFEPRRYSHQRTMTSRNLLGRLWAIGEFEYLCDLFDGSNSGPPDASFALEFRERNRSERHTLMIAGWPRAMRR